MAVFQDFQRASLDANMTVNIGPFQAALGTCDLSGMAILDFGCGSGNLLRLLRNTNAAVIYAFEVSPELIASDILEWSRDKHAKPRLIINPPAYKRDANHLDGDLTNYDYFDLLKGHDRFGIIGNPPYFLYNRILSLTGKNLAKGSEDYAAFEHKFGGALVITSQGRLHNHPGWTIEGALHPHDFDPPAHNTQYIVKTGLGAAFNQASGINQSKPAQKYVSINNRKPDADLSDHYPLMWHQLDSLRNRTYGV